MKLFPITSTALFKGMVVLLGIPAVLLLAFTGLLIFLGLGGGWAYAGAAGCHFVLNPFGTAMIAVVALGVFTLLYATGRQLIRRYQRHQRRFNH